MRLPALATCFALALAAQGLAAAANLPVYLLHSSAEPIIQSLGL